MTASMPTIDPSLPEGTGMVLPPLRPRFATGAQVWFRSAPISKQFWSVWNTAKLTLLEKGFVTRKEGDTWILDQWLAGKLVDGRLVEGVYHLTAIGIERLERAKREQQKPLAPIKVEMEFLPLPERLESKLRGYQVQPARQLLRALRHGKQEWGYPGAVALCDMGTGKAQPVNQPVLTPQGWRPIGSLIPGDEVISQDGEPCVVTSIHPQGIIPVFRVTMSDGTSTRCCGEHLWAVKSPNHRARNSEGYVKTTQELMNDLHAPSGNSRWFIPITKPVNLQTSAQSVDPYLLGLLLGDGCFRAGTPLICTADQEILDSVQSIIGDGMRLKQRNKYDYGILSASKRNPLTQELRALGLWGKGSWEKSIPSNYLFADEYQRLAILQGLMDTDGSVSGRGAEFSSCSRQLADDVRFLVESLGGTATIATKTTAYPHKGAVKQGRLCYRVSITCEQKLFRLTRKSNAPNRLKYFPRRSIQSITPDGNEDCVCIAVDHPTQTYLTDHCIVTHNTYHTLAAALATGRKVAVFCPPVGKGGWKRAFAHFGAEPHFLESYEAVRGAWRPEIATMDATGQFHWTNAEQIIVILDECQALRHESTLNFRCFSALLRQGIPCIAASATLALSPVEMKFAGRLVGLHQGGYDWDRFCYLHGCERKTKSRPWVWNKDLKHLRNINEQLFPYRGCRIRKEELGDQCPETEIKVLPIYSSQAETIEAETVASEQTIAALERRQAPKGQIVAMRRNLRMAIWKKCETALVPHIARMVQRDVADGWSVAIFVNFTETRETLGKLLGTSAGFFGGQSLKARQSFEKQFQNEEIHILISNLKAGGASVSLHDVNGVRSRRAYIFPSDDVIPMEQATGRVDRVGGMSKSEQFIPCLSGTRMVRTVENIRRKMMQISTLNDGADASGSKF